MKSTIGKKVDSKEQNTKKIRIDFRILLLIVAIVLVHQFYLTFGFVDEFGYADSFWIITLATGIIAITVGKKFWHHDVFRTSYMALGICFLMLFLSHQLRLV